MSWSHSPWNLNCLVWTRVNLLWLSYPHWIDSSWVALVLFNPLKLELPYSVYKSMIDILRLGYWWFFLDGWLWLVILGCSYLWFWELGKLVRLGSHVCFAMWMRFVLEAFWYCMVFVVILENYGVVSLFPLLGFVLDPHINLDGKWWYPNGLGGLDYHCT